MNGKYKILVVDDSKKVTELMFKVLSKTPHEIVVKNSVKEALNLVKSSSSFSVVISNQIIGGMKGTEFLKYLKKYSPQTVRMMITSAFDEKQLETMINSGEVFWCSLKPVNLKELLEAVNLGIEQYKLNILKNESG